MPESEEESNFEAFTILLPKEFTQALSDKQRDAFSKELSDFALEELIRRKVNQ